MEMRNRRKSFWTKKIDDSPPPPAISSHVQPQTWAKIEMCAGAMQRTGKLKHVQMRDEEREFKLEEILNYVSVMQRQLEQDFQDDQKLRKVLPLHMKKQLMERDRMMLLALMMAVFNYVTDILFLVKELVPVHKMKILASLLTGSLATCLFTRVGAVAYLFWQQMKARNKRFREEGGKHAKPSIFKTGTGWDRAGLWAAFYSLLTVIEPTEGLRLLKQAFDERKKFGTDFRGQDAQADAVANFAALDLHTAQSEMGCIAFGIVIDLINLFTQLAFLLFTKFDSVDSMWEVVRSLPVAFWVTIAATMLHLVFYGYELWVTWGETTDLKKDGAREAEFTQDNSDADVVQYAEKIGDSARSVKIKPCKPKGKKAQMPPCAKVTDRALAVLGTKCPRLQYVEFASCPSLIDPDKGWLPLVRSCRNLLHINLSFNKQVDDSWITPLWEHCPLLQEICLKKCVRITDTSVQALTRLENLRHLVVAECSNLTDKAFIGELGKIQALRWLAIDGLQKLTNEGIRKLLKRCGRNLEYAYLDGLPQLDDKTMVEVAQACHGLKKIGMKECVGISDETVAKLCECCPDLEQLGASYCPKVTHASVRAARGLEHLQKLFMEKKKAEENLSEESLKTWEMELTQLVKERGPQGTRTNALKSVYGPEPIGKVDVKKIAQNQKTRKALRALKTRVKDGSFRPRNETDNSVQNPVSISARPRAESTRVTHRFKLISGLQNGVDRGAMLGIDRARKRGTGAASSRDVKGGSVIGGVSTGGYMPLGFKCDDFIQDSVIDTSDEAKESIRKERKWVDEPVCEQMPEYIERFGMRELPSKAHKVSFKDKDLRNVENADILIAFRADVPNSGAGTEQTLNYALFGEYVFVEQFKNDKKAGGALLRDGMITNPGHGVQWREEQCRQRIPSPGSGDEARCPRLEFCRGKEYCVWKTFTHTTPKDEAKSAEKGRDCFKMQPVTAAQLQGSGEGGGREWVMQKAQRSAVSFVLKQFDSDSSGAESHDAELARQLVTFVQGVEKEWRNHLLTIMVTGPTEKVQPGVEERTSRIFERAFGVLLDQPRPEKAKSARAIAGIPASRKIEIGTDGDGGSISKAKHAPDSALL